MIKKTVYFVISCISLLFIISCSEKQLNPELFSWQAQIVGDSPSLRGISVLNETTVWVSGSSGFCARSGDGGKTWQTLPVPGADSLDFRDIQTFEGGITYLMSAGSGDKSRIYKSEENGKSWILQYQNSYPEGFYCSMAFWDVLNGIVFSDPVNGRFKILKTMDGGKNWREIPSENIPPAIDGEYAFAASGTCLITEGVGNAWIGSGGAAARVYRSSDKGETWEVAETPFVSGNQSSGIFSLAFKDSQNGIAVGGDYQQPDKANANLAITSDGGKTWNSVEDSLVYRSCVFYFPNPFSYYLIAVGRSGSDYSTDNGETWNTFSDIGYYTLSFAKSGLSGWAAGSDGRIAKFIYE